MNLRSTVLPCLLLGISLSFVFSPPSHAQTWQRLAPDLFDVQWLPPRTVVAAGSYGLVMRSDDAGASWQMQPTGAYRTLHALHFFSPQQGVVAGDSGTLFTTSDGGSTWHPASVPTEAHIYSLSFRGDGSGIAITRDSMLLESTDYGHTWNILQNSLPTIFQKVSLLKDSILCAATLERPGRIYRSEDGGRSWEAVYTTTMESLYTIYDMDFVGNVGIAVGGGVRSEAGGADRPLLLRTTDMGKTWERQRVKGADFELRSVGISPTGDRVIAAGVRPTSGYSTTSNQAVVSSDGGETWNLYEIADNTSYLSVLDIEMESSTTGVGVGSMEGIYLTTDGGQTWQTRSLCPIHELANDPMFFNTVVGSWLPDSDVMVAYGYTSWTSSGMYMRSTDGGITWNGEYVVDPIVGATFFSNGQGIGIPNPSMGRYFDASRKFYSIEEEGSVWIRGDRLFQDDYYYEYTSGPTKDGGKIYFTGDSMIFYSTDWGESWMLACTLSNAFSLSGLHVFGDQWIVHADFMTPEGIVYTMLRSEDRGATWDTIVGPTDILSSPRPYFRDRANGYYITIDRKLYRTTNSGATWDSVAQFDDMLNSMVFLTDSLSYLLGTGGMIARSTDAGRSWATEYIFPRDPAAPGLLNVQLSPDGRTVLATGPGLLAKGVFADPVTSVPHEPKRQEEPGTLQISIRPNPLVDDNARVHISGLGGEAAEVQLYDVAGRLLWKRTLTLQGEETTLPLAGKEMPPGVYRLVVRDGERQTSRPMTVLR